MMKYLAVAATFILFACSTESAKWTSADLEYRLAAIAGDTLTDSNIDRYAAALNNATAACPDSKSDVADFVVRGSQIADDMNIETSILELLRALPRAADASVSCRDVVASIIAMQQ
jgi:hypothetical protein